MPNDVKHPVVRKFCQKEEASFYYIFTTYLYILFTIDEVVVVEN